MPTGNRAVNSQTVDTADVAPRDWTSGVDDEADDENAAVPRFHGSRCLRLETRFCSRTFRFDLAGPAVADKSTAFFFFFFEVELNNNFSTVELFKFCLHSFVT